MTLGPERFPDFYAAVNGYPPFPWQTRLVEQVILHGGRWPAVLDLPTSAGKTSALDAAVFLLAAESGMSVHDRKAALRTFFVVDRRIVVDEAADKARKLAKLLNNPPADREIIRTVAERLKWYSGEKPVRGPDTRKALHVSVLRGGMYRDGSWAESPTQPTICLSTVDQVGSRLLFRGYGVGANQRAVHAGLVGNDALILVDEAHLSRPFIETLKAVEFYRSDRWAESWVKTPFQVSVMSATAGDAATPLLEEPDSTLREWLKKPFQLDPKTDRNPAVCPPLVRRLKAKKLAKLAEAGEDEFVPSVVDRAIKLSQPDKGIKPASVIGVVVNRVRTARAVADLLRERFRTEKPPAPEAPDLDVILLTGRIRPYDRDELLFRRVIPNLTSPGYPHRGLLPFVKASANDARDDYGRPAPPRGTLFVVATQTVEVGADFSFDALVTELAPLDSLRQRFGRVDRLGFRDVSQAVIVRNKDAPKDDPVYGPAPVECWKQLKLWEKASGRQKEIDFGIDAIEARFPPDPRERYTFLTPLCAPFGHAPVMMPAHVDDLVQTTVPPVPDPSPELFLHGPLAGPADVSVVWRADISEAQLAAVSETNRKAREAAIIATVALVPPVSMEALSMPIWAVRKWLAKNHPGDVTDVEGEADPDADDRRRKVSPGRPFLRWRGPDADDGSKVDTQPRPGDTIVVPNTYGGCDEYGWNPDSRDPVSDVADDCSWRAKRRQSCESTRRPESTQLPWLRGRNSTTRLRPRRWRNFPPA
ncbi:MAG TPA: type I-U CRISPR-associated helicase/endonuclease Cas3 [Urbifossiella sp.]|nr:type I-U CRISPR-associated helicase/endonuclease Cas3 [Urbifossiella sp.]